MEKTSVTNNGTLRMTTTESSALLNRRTRSASTAFATATGSLEPVRLVASHETIRVAATGETTVSGNVFVAKTPETYTYDTDGNLTQDGRWDYTWDGENRLVKMESRTTGQPTGSKLRLEFAYDDKGRRIWKKVTSLDTSTVLSENKFVYDGWNLIATLNAASVMVGLLRKNGQ